jgi:anaerobic magnesium-protoporphyrin IX monomethyl ester cyclase
MIVLFNPLSTTPGKQPLPLSLMSLAAVLERGDVDSESEVGVKGRTQRSDPKVGAEGRTQRSDPEVGAEGRTQRSDPKVGAEGRVGSLIPWTLVDGNVVPDPAAEIIARLSVASSSDVSLLAVSVMPGPQLTQAVAVCARVKAALPHVPIVWGGYFPTQHVDTVLRAPYVDFVIRSQGERSLLQLIAVLQTRGLLNSVGGLSWKADGDHIVNNPVQPLTNLDDLPELPYHRVDMERYIHKNYLGARTVAHNSSFGCPFACSFCAVVAMSNRRWLAQSPARLERVMRRLVSTYRVDAVQMHDMDFFISEARTAEFASRIAGLGLRWWGLGRVDTQMQYRDATWTAMARSGLKMIFSGADSGADATLEQMNKGGKSSAALTLELACRMRSYGIVPEFSFVLGCPPDPVKDVESTFDFIRRVKQINPATEIVLYTYTPVPLDGGLYTEARRLGFSFPETLEQWASPEWERLSMRRGDGIPWMERSTGHIRQRVRDFERVVNAFYPTVTDLRLTGWRRAALRAAGGIRYRLKWYRAPYELRVLNRLVQYQRPETTGF